MSSTDTANVTSETGFGLPWWASGVLGGVVGAAAFGSVMWVGSPEMLRASIPALYGFEPSTTVGWTVHLFHGAILGLAFGAIARLDPVAQYVEMDVETDALRKFGVNSRLVALGLVYGMAVWAILPVVVMPIWLGTVGAADAPTMPAIAVESLFGHLAFGLVLGVVFGSTVDW